MNWRHILILCCGMFLMNNPIFSQSIEESEGEVIYLTNSSFEDIPKHSKTPRGWYDCGFLDESPPDVQPSGEFGVIKPAIDGDTYLGMVVRDNDTWEAVAQRLSSPMKKGQCYSFSIYLARSELYLSLSRKAGASNKEANYITPAKLRIYGGFDYCDKQYMLGETSLIINERWIEFNFKFEPIDDYTYIIFEAFYKTPTLFPYNGNLLIDKASAINPIPCNEEEVVEEVVEETVEPTPDPVTTPAAQSVPPSTEKATEQPVEPTTAPEEVVTTTPEVTKEEPVETPNFNPEMKKEELKVGQKLRIDKLYFGADESIIQANSFNALNELFAFMANNSDIVIEVGGHTNGLPPDGYCDNLSTQRAKAVVDYLIKKGISSNRLKFKGYGKRELIASDATLEGRRKNQRVEIKILSKNG